MSGPASAAARSAADPCRKAPAAAVIGIDPLHFLVSSTLISADVDEYDIIGALRGKPVEVFHIDRIKDVAKERKIEIGIIATPPSEAQSVANMLVEAEVKGILNFAPAQVTVPEGFMVKDVFFTTILDNLAYLLSN